MILSINRNVVFYQGAKPCGRWAYLLALLKEAWAAGRETTLVANGFESLYHPHTKKETYPFPDDTLPIYTTPLPYNFRTLEETKRSKWLIPPSPTETQTPPLS